MPQPLFWKDCVCGNTCNLFNCCSSCIQLYDEIWSVELSNDMYVALNPYILTSIHHLPIRIIEIASRNMISVTPFHSNEQPHKNNVWPHRKMFTVISCADTLRLAALIF